MVPLFGFWSPVRLFFNLSRPRDRAAFGRAIYLQIFAQTVNFVYTHPGRNENSFIKGKYSRSSLAIESQKLAQSVLPTAIRIIAVSFLDCDLCRSQLSALPFDNNFPMAILQFRRLIRSKINAPPGATDGISRRKFGFSRDPCTVREVPTRIRCWYRREPTLIHGRERNDR